MIFKAVLHRLIPKYFSLKNNILSTPFGVDFSIFYQLLCQDLKLYSTSALQNRKLDKLTKTKERDKLMAVHMRLDMASALFEKHKDTICPNEYHSNNMRLYEKDLDFFIETILMDSLNMVDKSLGEKSPKPPLKKVEEVELGEV